MFDDLTYHPLPGRAKYLPPLYRYKGSSETSFHPLRHLAQHEGTTYIYVLDGSEEGLELAKSLSLIGEVPKGNTDRIAALGKLFA